MKWGILATGNIAKKFASTINQMSKENEQLVAVGSRNIESAKAFAKEHDIPRYYDSYEALVKDQDVEVVYVATQILCIMRIAGYVLNMESMYCAKSRLR